MNNEHNDNSNNQHQQQSRDSHANESNTTAKDDVKDDDDDNDGDAIGDTIFSKHWLFQCLIKALDIINREPKSSDDPIELDADAEEELCVLWDMSANEDIAKFLNDFKAIDLFEGIIVKTNSPRLAEIAAGILANIAVNNEICIAISNKHGFRDLIISLLQSSDTPFILQLIRLINTALSNSEVRSLWTSSISNKSEEFFPMIQYTFENCLNCDVLKGLLLLIYKILYYDDTLSNKWLLTDQSNDCVKSLLRTSQQLINDDDDNIECIDNHWLILHMLLLSDEEFVNTHMTGIENDMYELFDRYINGSFGDSVDYIISSQNRAGALAAAVSIILQIMSSETSIRYQMLNNYDLIDCVRNLRSNCTESLGHIDGHNSGQSNSYHLALEQLNALIAFIADTELESNCIVNHEATR